MLRRFVDYKRVESEAGDGRGRGRPRPDQPAAEAVTKNVDAEQDRRGALRVGKVKWRKEAPNRLLPVTAQFGCCWRYWTPSALSPSHLLLRLAKACMQLAQNGRGHDKSSKESPLRGKMLALNRRRRASSVSNCRVRRSKSRSAMNVAAGRGYASVHFRQYMKHHRLALRSRHEKLLPWNSVAASGCFCGCSLWSATAVRVRERMIKTTVHLPLSSTSRSEAWIFCCSTVGAFGSKRPSFCAFFQARTLSVRLSYSASGMVYLVTADTSEKSVRAAGGRVSPT